MVFQKGQSGNPKGRAKGSGGGLKDYVRQKFVAMSAEEKEEFLKTIAPELQWRMGEGNPANDLNVDGEIRLPLYLPSELLEKNAIPQITENNSE